MKEKGRDEGVSARHVVLVLFRGQGMFPRQALMTSFERRKRLDNSLELAKRGERKSERARSAGVGCTCSGEVAGKSAHERHSRKVTSLGWRAVGAEGSGAATSEDTTPDLLPSSSACRSSF